MGKKERDIASAARKAKEGKFALKKNEVKAITVKNSVMSKPKVEAKGNKKKKVEAAKKKAEAKKSTVKKVEPTKKTAEAKKSTVKKVEATKEKETTTTTTATSVRSISAEDIMDAREKEPELVGAVAVKEPEAKKKSGFLSKILVPPLFGKKKKDSQNLKIFFFETKSTSQNLKTLLFSTVPT